MVYIQSVFGVIGNQYCLWCIAQVDTYLETHILVAYTIQEK